jgi:hypothetical protein
MKYVVTNHRYLYNCYMTENVTKASEELFVNQLVSSI